MTTSLIFSEHAERIARMGYAVIPLKEKAPLIGGFQKFNRPPSLAMIHDWSRRFADANIGVIAGLSGIVIVDRDDSDAEIKGDEIFGPSPLVILTARGSQAYYGLPPGATVSSGPLRKQGLNIDIKSGSGYGLVPPSIHPKSGKPYALAPGTDLSLRKELVHLAPFNVEALERLREPSAREREAEGGRAQSINDRLCGEFVYCATFDELLARAHRCNAEFTVPLDEQEVVRIASRVWGDVVSGKLQRWHGGAGVVKLGGDVLECLLRLSPNGSDAFTLLAVLQREHGARVRRGETFHITPKAMANGTKLPGWSRNRIERARGLLLQSGYLLRTREFKSKSAGALFRLAEHCV
jgi:hypothetical protein